ncbi:MAG TPA: response regulator [Vicinamibacterales bacterium]|jgi:FixJ family two-component response regulator
MMRPAGRVWIVDNDRDALTLITTHLATARFDVRACSSAEEFLRHRPLTPPACVIIDQSLPGVSGLELQQHLAEDPAVSVVFVTAHKDIPTVVQAMKKGAIDFLSKPVNPLALVSAVTRGMEQSTRADVDRRARERFSASLMRLTRREYQVIAGVIRGLLNKQIAWELGTAEKTVKVHRARAMDKLEVGSVAELARIVAATQTLLQFPSTRAGVAPAAARGSSDQAPLHGLHSPARDGWHEI